MSQQILPYLQSLRTSVATISEIAETSAARLKEFPPGMYASMYHDYAKGGPIEIEGMSGYLVREGRRLGIPTPHHAAIYAVLKPHRAGLPKIG